MTGQLFSWHFWLFGNSQKTNRGKRTPLWHDKIGETHTVRLQQWYRGVPWKPYNFLGFKVVRLFISFKNETQKMQFLGAKKWQVESVAPQRKVAKPPHRFDRYHIGLIKQSNTNQTKICPNPNILECSSSRSPWTRANMHVWVYGWNMHAFRKSSCVSKISPVRQKNWRITVSVFLSTSQQTALLLKIFRLRLHGYTLLSVTRKRQALGHSPQWIWSHTYSIHTKSTNPNTKKHTISNTFFLCLFHGVWIPNSIPWTMRVVRFWLITFKELTRTFAASLRLSRSD